MSQKKNQTNKKQNLKQFILKERFFLLLSNFLQLFPFLPFCRLFLLTLILLISVFSKYSLSTFGLCEERDNEILHFNQVSQVVCQPLLCCLGYCYFQGKTQAAALGTHAGRDLVRGGEEDNRLRESPVNSSGRA